ncbi:MAG: hypothetical protein AB7G87_13400 [Clostridia bacterium]
MDVDRMQKGDYFNLDSAVPISANLVIKLANILSTESALMSFEIDENSSCMAKLYLLANPLEYYKEMNKIIQKSYKCSNELSKYRRYKENIRAFNSVNIIEKAGSFYIDLQCRSAQGFIDLINSIN